MSVTTDRDRIWAVLLEEQQRGRSRIKIDQILRRIDFEDRPHRETVRRTLNAAGRLGVLKHRSGSPWWRYT